MKMMLIATTLAIMAALCNSMPEIQSNAIRSNGTDLTELIDDEWEAFKSLMGSRKNRCPQQAFGTYLPANGLKLTKNRTPVGTFLPPAIVQVPDAVDWRTEGYVTPVKDQQQCESSWAFSATGALEGQIFRNSGNLVSLSEQNLIDCSGGFGNNGCNGGLTEYAFNYIRSNGGINTELDYPYEGQEGRCRYNEDKQGGYLTGFMDVKSGDEEMLKVAVATIGPISVFIDAPQEGFQFYSQGIYYDTRCSANELNHAALVVGYDSEGGQDYWILKDNWGEGWGEKGYIRMARNRDNHCGIASSAIYPTV